MIVLFGNVSNFMAITEVTNKNPPIICNIFRPLFLFLLIAKICQTTEWKRKDVERESKMISASLKNHQTFQISLRNEKVKIFYQIIINNFISMKSSFIFISFKSSHCGLEIFLLQSGKPAGSKDARVRAPFSSQSDCMTIRP